MAQPLIASLKVASEMDIAERRRSQDGSFKATVAGRTIDFRVSTAPSAYGEKMVIRVLDKAKGIRRLENLGFQPGILEQIRKVIHQPHGMLLVCGPTGSGKSTTLYAALSEMDATRKNIITIENPIEYHLPNVTQTAINEKAGVTFASVLRSSLRQDPNVLMIGEIRDTETAQVGLQAAMTGHLVFSTVHANDSVSSVFRLLDLGAEPFMLSSGLSGVLAQRLIKMLCPACKQPYSPKPEFITLARKRGIEVTHFYKPVGCDKCNQGYRGRLGAFELLVMNDKLRSLIQSSPTVTDLHTAAKEAGLIYLREDALIKAAQGLTSVEQVLSLTTV
jgi:type II secretory ATPase GspE/PulE/Tfp pilus assembly ATPase PilB-like protein